jgi:serine/threonine-protein kinase
MAPEQAQGLREQIDGRTDQFALAALAYTLLTGRTPFSRETPVAILYAVVHEEPAELGAAVGWDAAPVERVLRRGLARRRADRYPSVLAFADALEEALIEGKALPKPATPAPLRLIPTSGRTPSTAELQVPRSFPALRSGGSAVLLSVLLAGALWGGTHVNMKAVRARVSREWSLFRNLVVGETGNTTTTEGRGR